jgi:ABC-type antimicrobial peptide transport system permease subunit
MYNALIVPIENISKIYNPSYDLELTVNGKDNYPEAQKRFNSFTDTASYSLAEDVYVGSTGALEFFKSIIRIVFIFLASIWLVGILSMINSVNTSVLNRSRELMMLRSVGMTRKQLRKSVILETLMFSSTAAVCGTIIGVAVFLMFVFFILENAYLLSIISIVVVVVLALTVNIIISVLAALPAIRSLGRVESIAQAANG